MWQWAWDAPELDADHDVLSSFAQSDAWFGLPDIPYHHRGRFDPPAEKIALWKPEYTHPDKTSPGFTHDFAPPDDVSLASIPQTTIVLDEAEAGPSSSASASSNATAVETTLVCARCLDPLVLAPADGTTEVATKKRRVWALRCGHMLDGKCITELMSPSEAPASSEAVEPHAPVQDVKGKGKGKARAEPEADSSTDETSAAAARPDAAPDRKGKRKAVEPPEPESPKRQALASPTSSPASSPPEDNSIRSRLRSRARGAAVAATPPAGAAPAPHPDAGPSSSIATSPRRSRRQHQGAVSLTQTRAKGKGKGRARIARKPAVEAEHEWRCPVGGCGCVHYSVRVEGVWKNDEGRGPIALFV
ncbi:hypothetical protein BD413DRAFT_534365 [Trametes elegans]|nr:hypothetical protein BD413DRAFT_534365 [Trametes elegans]